MCVGDVVEFILSLYNIVICRQKVLKNLGRVEI